MQLRIYHNPRCSKSRATLALLEARGLEPEVIHYLEQPPDAATLRSLLAKLGLTVDELMRRNEPVYKADRERLEQMDEAGRIDWLATHPQALQRPIVVAGERARIGRPPEAVLEILDS
ncbi:MAG: arsenate reductase (glutaredoxin) [Gammaproteobacteria bacterium]|nr:MAG: arsenate reductase (glutaredoxin) [Gammaproteobacteria bacterium]